MKCSLENSTLALAQSVKLHAARQAVSPLPTSGRALSGLVYIIKAFGMQMYKIGYSKDLESAYRRLNTFQKGSPVALYFVSIIPNKRIKDEKKIHKEMIDFQIHGEWFARSEELSNLIKNFPSTKFVELGCEGDPEKP
jgi:hypothetical protein